MLVELELGVGVVYCGGWPFGGWPCAKTTDGVIVNGKIAKNIAPKVFLALFRFINMNLP